MKIAIAGSGYVGLVTAVCLAEYGHDVTCVDTDETKIEALSQGKPPIHEDGLIELMTKNAARLTYTTDRRSAYAQADIIFIGVGTPEKADGSANLSYVYQVAAEIADAVQRDVVVCIKSTVPIGTNDALEQFMRERLSGRGIAVDVVSNPEFLSQGTAVSDTFNPSRIVIGAENEAAALKVKQLYDGIDAPVLVTGRKSAEMIKYASNDFLALKISYINEIANLCEITGVNIEEVTAGMGYDPRIGDRFLKAGIGYGGSCFPKDTKALHWFAAYNNCELKTVNAAIVVNENQKLKLLKKARKYFGHYRGLTVAVLGLSFKPNTDDVREAPSLVNIPVFLEDGATVKAWDPAAADKFSRLFPDVRYCKTIEETLTDADICFIFTEWQEVKAFDIAKFKQLMKNPVVLDGRNCYAVEDMRAAGVVYESIGR